MKKIAILSLFVLATLSFTGAQINSTKNIEVSLNVARILEFSVTNVPLGTIQPGVGVSGTGTATIRTNYFSWKVEVSALNGILKLWDSTAIPAGFVVGGATIPYTFSFNTADTTAGRFFANQTLGTSPTAATTATFTSRTTGGTTGQAFGYSVNVPAPTGTNDWDAGEYRDTIYMKVTVN